MIGQYTKLTGIPENQYTDGSPVIILGGALVKENQTDKVFTQLKFKNISYKRINAIIVSVAAFDVTGKELEGVSEYQYLDLAAGRDAEFGQVRMIEMPDSVTRSISIKCSSVIFADKTRWDAPEAAEWASLPEQKTLESAFGDLATQFKREIKSFTSNMRFKPQKTEKLWFCACGAVNYDSETSCHKCNLNRELQFNACDKEKLIEAKEAFDRAHTQPAQPARTSMNINTGVNMREQYTKLAGLPENQYTEGSPVIIVGGALLKGNTSGQIFTQLKFKNISNKRITAIIVSVDAYDITDRELEGVPEYQYLDLAAGRDAEFGQARAIEMPNNVTRSVNVKCKTVIFADKTRWEAPEAAEWVSLPKQKTLENALGDLVQQYKRDIDNVSYRVRFEPVQAKDLWFCVCGEGINHDDEAACHKCRMDRDPMFEAYDKEKLAEHNEAYETAVAEERARRKEETEKRRKEQLEAAAKRKAEWEADMAARREQREIARKKKNKVILLVSGIVVFTLAVAAACIYFFVLR